MLTVRRNTLSHAQNQQNKHIELCRCVGAVHFLVAFKYLDTRSQYTKYLSISENIQSYMVWKKNNQSAGDR